MAVTKATRHNMEHLRALMYELLIELHSKEDKPDEILEFCRRYADISNAVPLVAAPTTYCQVTEEQLSDFGVNVVIYANHMLRSAFPAMERAAKLILATGRAQEVDDICTPIKDIITLL